MDLFLRIAPELYLKRCLVGGIERVFEINRNFRNEGADSSHSPEFAMIESYQAYGDWRDGMELTRGLVQEAANSIFGSTVVTHFNGRESDLGGPWDEISLFDSVSKALGETIAPDTPYEKLVEYAKKVGLSVDPKWIHGKLVEELFEHLVIDTFTKPTFVMGYPVDTSPLVRSHRDIPGVVEKWDLYVDGFELATGYSELVDPVIQRERLVAQAQLGAKGDLEAMALDEDFLRALEVGMPPTAGMGMGVDRLLMALTGLGIRETILFPLVKPE
jgi:lysyl-tRNA synthetase class 2